jgi:hypothetical protein
MPGLALSQAARLPESVFLALPSLFLFFMLVTWFPWITLTGRSHPLTCFVNWPFVAFAFVLDTLVACCCHQLPTLDVTSLGK